MLRLYFSNRYETLSERLFADLAVPPDDPFVAEPIIVPGTAIRRRLEMDYADRFGICANVVFGYLAQWIWQRIGLVIEVPEASPFDAERLTWRIFRAFGDTALIAPHPRLSAYLGKADPVMRYRFAHRLARQFEQYITYRPDWLAAWTAQQSVFRASETRTSAQADEAWQADLWRYLANELAIGPEHPSVRFLRTLEAPNAAGAASPVLCQPRAALFCLPTIPPLYLDILARLGEWVDLNLYVLSPCREYWHDLVDAKRLARLRTAGAADYHEIGHRLLAGWGRQSQAYLALLNERTAGRGAEFEDYTSPGRSTLLMALQDEILTLESFDAHTLPANDTSLQVHVCHSLTRELEVLHDQLLDLLSGPEAFAPADILVVLPALDAAAPLIHAVFGTAPQDRHIAYTVTGLPRAAANPAASALLALIGLLASRFRASEVFELLRRPLVHTRFGLDEEALERIHQWMRESGIRWGLDAEHRVSHGLPGFDHHSLLDGLDRLFLGFAVPQRAEPLADRLPAGDAEGASALILGAFDDYVVGLEAAHRESLDPATGDVWFRRLNEWIDRFIQVDSSSIHDVAELRGAVTALCDDLAFSASGEIFGIDVIGAALTDRLEDPACGAIPSGSVTFTGIGPFRQLPYRAICILGLNDGMFPVLERPDEFDLMACAPRPGDRQRRYDDRNLFLDLVLAARERLYLSYTGFSIRDNSALRPSLLLAELVDHACALLTGASGSAEALAAARRRLIVQHPLQAFSRRYFESTEGGDSRLFSFAAEYVPNALPASSSATLLRETPADEALDGVDEDEGVPERREPFFARPLAPPAEDTHDLTLDDLKRFMRGPCRFLLERRLGLALREADDQLADDEPFIPDFIERGALAERLLPVLRAGAGEIEIAALARAGTEYPIGAYGDVLRERELALIIDFGQAIAELTRESPLPPVAGRLEFQLDGERWTLSGALNDLRSSGLVRWRYDDTRPVDYLSGWIDHLFLSALATDSGAPQTLWQSRNGRYRLAPCDAAKAHLAFMIDGFRHGLSAPFHFFPKSGWDYVKALPDGREAALKAAGKRWMGGRDRHGEGSVAAYRLALRGVENPLDEAFERAAIAVFQPLVEHLVEGPPE